MLDDLVCDSGFEAGIGKTRKALNAATDELLKAKGSEGVGGGGEAMVECLGFAF